MKKFRIGIVGAGLIAKDHAKSLTRLPSVKSVSFFDTDTDRAHQAAEQYHARVSRSLRELANESDVVWICTPPFGRREAILEACRAKRPIFCEKPLGISLNECRFVENAVRKAGIRFFMGQSNRYSTFFQKMKALVEDGAIGRPTMVWSTRLGLLDPKTAAPWRLNDRLSGGTVIELGVHEIDFTRWIGGDWQTVSAVASSRILVPGKFQDTLVAVGTLRGGVIARIDLSWANPRYLWQRGVEGEKGSLFFDDCNLNVQWLRPSKKPVVFTKFEWTNKDKENLTLRDQAIDIFNALSKNKKATVTLCDGFAAVRVALAMRESARTGRVVKIS